MDAEQKYLFDLQECLVLKDVVPPAMLRPVTGRSIAMKQWIQMRIRRPSVWDKSARRITCIYQYSGG